MFGFSISADHNMTEAVSRKVAVNAVAALKYPDARSAAELAHNAALSEAVAALSALPGVPHDLSETGDALGMRNP